MTNENGMCPCGCGKVIWSRPDPEFDIYDQTQEERDLDDLALFNSTEAKAINGGQS